MAAVGTHQLRAGHWSAAEQRLHRIRYGAAPSPAALAAPTRAAPRRFAGCAVRTCPAARVAAMPVPLRHPSPDPRLNACPTPDMMQDGVVASRRWPAVSERSGADWLRPGPRPGPGFNNNYY